MANVFIIEAPRSPVNLTVAERYGELKYIFGPSDRRCSVFQVAEYGELIVQKFRNAEFDHATDHICMVGGMVPVIVAIAALLQVYPTLSLLLYQARDSLYVKRTIGKDVWQCMTA